MNAFFLSLGSARLGSGAMAEQFEFKRGTRTDVIRHDRGTFERSVNGGPFEPISLQRLRDEYAAKTTVWAWIRMLGYKRPTPSGTNQTPEARTRAGRRVMTVWLPDRVYAKLERMMRARDLSKTEAIIALIEDADG